MPIAINQIQVSRGALSAAEVLAPQITTSYGLPSLASGTTVNVGIYGIAENNIATPRGYRTEFPAIDITSCKYFGFGLYTASEYFLYLDTIANGGTYIVLQDSFGAWVRFNVHGSDWFSWSPNSAEGEWVNWQGFELPNSNFATINLSTAPQESGGGTFSYASLVAVEMIVRPISSNYTVRRSIGHFCGINPSVGTGTVSLVDFAESPASASQPDTKRQREFNRAYEFQQSIYGTFVTQLGFVVGDGSTVTSWTEENFQLTGWENGVTATQVAPWLNLVEERFVDVNQSVSDTLDLSNAVIGTLEVNPLFGYRLRGTPGTLARCRNITFLGLSVCDLGHGTYIDCSFDSLVNPLIITGAEQIQGASRVVNSAAESINFTGAPGDYSDLSLDVDSGILIGSGGAGTYVLTSVTSSGTINIHNESVSSAVIVEIAAGINYTISTAGGSITVQQPQAQLKIRCVELVAGVPTPLQGAMVYIVTTGDGDIADGTELIKGLTNVDGTITATLQISNPQQITGRGRKSSSDPYYKTSPISATVPPAGLDLDVIMIRE